MNTTMMIRAPYLALTIGSGAQALYHDVVRGRSGTLHAELARWLDGLTVPRARATLEAELGRLGVGESLALLQRLVGAGLIVDADRRADAGFPEPIVVVGYGLHAAADLSMAALAVLRDAARVLVMDADARVGELAALNHNVESLDHHFDAGQRRDALERIADAVIDACLAQPGTVFALYGNPRVGCLPTSLLLRAAAARGAAVRMIAGASFLDTAFIEFDFDPFEGFALLTPHSLAALDPTLHTIIGALGYDRDAAGKRAQLEQLVGVLTRHYPEDHRIQVACGGADRATQTTALTLAELPTELPSLAASLVAGGTSIYLPPAPTPTPTPTPTQAGQGRASATRWGLSPRWRVVGDPGSGAVKLAGPGDHELAIEPELARALAAGRTLAQHELGDVTPAVAARALVPAHLARHGQPSTAVRDHYLEVVEAAAAELGVPDLAGQIGARMVAWSGRAYEQPLGTHRAYLPCLPTLCVDVGPSEAPPSVLRFCVDCRDPVRGVWDNIEYARETAARLLPHGTELADRISDQVFRDRTWFGNPYIKYLHPAIEIGRRGERASLYWNPGAGTPEQLWTRSYELLAALGIDDTRERRLQRALGEHTQPELYGHTFSDQPELKVYHMFEGLDAERLACLLELEGVEHEGETLLRAPTILREQGYDIDRLVWIASHYHRLDGQPGAGGVKLHFVLPTRAGGSLTPTAACSVLAELTAAPSYPPPLPDTLALGGGRRVGVDVTTISLMLRPGRGLSKQTFYVGFHERS